MQEFENLASDELGVPLVAGLAVELVTAFNRFPDIEARYGGVQAAISPAEIALDTPVYLLSGVVRRVPDGTQYGVLLTDTATEEIIDTVDVTVPTPGGIPTMSLRDVSRHIVMRVASPRDALHGPVRVWLAGRPDGPLEFYPCLATFFLYTERHARIENRQKLDCAQRLAPVYAEAQAIEAVLLADDAWQLGPDTVQGREQLERARDEASAARETAPTSAFVWAASAYVAMTGGDLTRARDSFNSAYQLNPAAVDMVAAYARLLAQMGNWRAALRLSADATSADPNPPSWYQLVQAMHALRMGDYRAAIDNATPMDNAYPDLAAAILVAAGGAARDIDTLNTYLPRLLTSQRFRRLGILPALRLQISDPELLRQLSNGMSIAGVPLDRLARPF